MYEEFYGLTEKPFSLTPDPEFIYMGDEFREALDRIIYGIKRREGFTVIVGDVGTGKTMLCWTLLGRLGQNVRTALILNPLLSEDDILRAILQDFGVRPARYYRHPAAGDGGSEVAPYDPGWMVGLSRKELIDELNNFLLGGASEEAASLLLIDEAQNLSSGVLEQLRVLSNLETPKRKLLQIIFIGQLEFEQKLALPELRQLNQRITVRYELRPLSREDAAQYIRHRLVVAGGSRKVSFTADALKSICKHSSGYPRLINIICDRALLSGYRERSRTITAKMVRQGLADLRGKKRTAAHVRLAGSLRWALPIFAAAVILLMVVAFLLKSAAAVGSW
jgi:general secretion pathway protein A